MPRKRQHDKKFYQYIEDVESGKFVSGELMKLSIKRFMRDIKKKDFHFDYERGERLVNFIEKLCRHWKGDKAGAPILLEPHQHFYFINLFGWIRDDGTRRFRLSYKEVARKNAKTTEAALSGIFHMGKDGEAGAQVYATATKEAQATIVVNDAGQIIKASPALRNRFGLFELRGQVKRVVFEPSAAFMAPLGRDSDTQDGFDPSMAIIDEYHAHESSERRDVLESGMGARPQPLTNIITTAGFNKNGPCYDLRKTAIDVLRGTLHDDTFFVNIHALDEADDWNNPDIWIKPNPNMHASVKLDNLIDMHKKAVNEKGQKEVDFKTKNLNIWTDASVVFIPDRTWKKNHHGISIADLSGKVCYGGLDLASVSDITAYVLLFPEAFEIKGKKITPILPFFYMPSDNLLEKSKQSRVDYQRWVNEGHITLTEGNITDYGYVLSDIVKLKDRYGFKSLAIDPWAAGDLIGQLGNLNIEVHELRQTISHLTNPTKMFERMALGGQFEHFNNPVLRWMLGNVELKRDPSGNVRPDKEKSQNKIDGISATINALAEWMTFKDANESAGFFVIPDNDW